MKPLIALAKEHGLQVIEDACQAHGSRLDTGGMAGSENQHWLRTGHIPSAGDHLPLRTWRTD